MKKYKIVLLYILSAVVSIAPILTFFFMNLERYTKTVPETVKLCFGAVILLCIVVLKVIGKLRIPSAVTLYSIMFILAYLLESIINDLMIFAFLALLGEIFSLIVDLVIKRCKERLMLEKSASMTVEGIEKIITKHIGGGRV